MYMWWDSSRGPNTQGKVSRSMWAEPGVEIVIGVLMHKTYKGSSVLLLWQTRSLYSAHCRSKEVLALSVLGFGEEVVL